MPQVETSDRPTSVLLGLTFSKFVHIRTVFNSKRFSNFGHIDVKIVGLSLLGFRKHFELGQL